jgi:hypothetical protein
MIVEEFGQLLAQTFVALAFVSENDRAFKERLLKLLRELTPQVHGSAAENKQIAVSATLPGGAIRWLAHHDAT